MEKYKNGDNDGEGILVGKTKMKKIFLFPFLLMISGCEIGDIGVAKKIYTENQQKKVFVELRNGSKIEGKIIEEVRKTYDKNARNLFYIKIESKEHVGTILIPYSSILFIEERP